MNFGKGIVVSFVLFALFIFVLVVICVQQDVNLVSINYYQEELVHSEKMDQIKNTNLLLEQPSILVLKDYVELHFSRLVDVEKGEVTFIRPSDSHLDKIFKVESAMGDVQQFQLTNFVKGQYRARFKWTMEGRDYFYEKLIVI